MKRAIIKLKNRRWLLLTIAIIILAGSGYGVFWFNRPKAINTTSISLSEVIRGDIKVSITGTGNVNPEKEQSLQAEVTGKVEEIYYHEGEQVHAGDLIYILSNSSLQTELTKARVNMENALLDYDTTSSRVRDLEVRAPIDGVIEQLQIQKGDTVSKDQVLVIITDNSSLEMKIPLNFPQKQKVSPGDKARITFPSSFATYDGEVVSVDQAGTPNGDGSISYYVYISFKNPGGFVEGETGYATIITEEGEVKASKPGTVELSDSVEIEAPAEAVVEKVFKRERDYVSQGELIASLSSDDLRLEQMTKDIQLKQAQLEYQEKQDQVAALKIYAEIDGIIAGQNVIPGDEIFARGSDEASSQTVSLGSVFSNQKQITIPVDELDISRIQHGQKAVVTVEALSGQTFEGTVSKVSEMADIQNGVATYDVTITIPQGEKIKAGMTADVEILVDSKKDVLLVPVEAVIERNGGQFVMVPIQGQKDKENRLEQIKVTTGIRNERYVEITEGLTEGQKIVLSGLSGESTQNSRPPMGGGFGMPGMGAVRRQGGR